MKLIFCGASASAAHAAGAGVVGRSGSGLVSDCFSIFAGGYALLVIFVAAIVLHVLTRGVNAGGLLVYAAAVHAVLANRVRKD